MLLSRGIGPVKLLEKRLVDGKFGLLPPTYSLGVIYKRVHEGQVQVDKKDNVTLGHFGALQAQSYLHR